MGQYLLKDSQYKEKGQESAVRAQPRLPRTALSKGRSHGLMCLTTARSGKGRAQIRAS